MPQPIKSDLSSTKTTISGRCHFVLGFFSLVRFIIPKHPTLTAILQQLSAKYLIIISFYALISCKISKNDQKNLMCLFYFSLNYRGAKKYHKWKLTVFYLDYIRVV